MQEFEFSEAAKALKLGRYRHFKGNEYQVIGVAFHSETLEALVVYQKLYGNRYLCVRPLAMFTEVVERDGKRMPRFEYIGGNSFTPKLIEQNARDHASPSDRQVGEQTRG